MISDLQADIDQENEPDFSKSFPSQIEIVPLLWTSVCNCAPSITFAMNSLQTQQLDFLKRGATRGRIVRGREVGEARTKSREDSWAIKSQISKRLPEKYCPGWPLAICGSTLCRGDLSSRDFVEGGDHRVNSLRHHQQNNRSGSGYPDITFYTLGKH